jgi:drug/metabolite transporter (DMT)-like permease
MVQCAILVTVSALSSILAIKITSFPIVMMIKSCSIIPVVFVGFFCSKVKDNALKLGADKIVTALFISIGILIYNFGGDKDSVNKATSVIGILLLIISVLADGFLPDVQAVIKSEFNPHPTEMFEHTNKWIALISILYALLAG